ncbi:MAG: thiamine diphosphokinase [Syntrophobacterales bacterium]|jgi:thiamine pyrophosphokinase|nr:thiamine diphosphokinase [Syntrophobacterales bacterium]
MTEEMSKRLFIVSGGPMPHTQFLRTRVRLRKPFAIVCADSGVLHALAENLIPHTVIGDMDSLPAEILRDLENTPCQILRYPCRKDKTDTELALRYAWEQNPDEIEIYGALGGRLDHALANISLLAASAQRGITTTIIEEHTEVFLVTSQTEIRGHAGDIVSLFPVTPEVTGITLEGFSYPLQNARMEIGQPYGISNVLTQDAGIVSIAAGYLLVIHNR